VRASDLAQAGAAQTGTPMNFTEISMTNARNEADAMGPIGSSEVSIGPTPRRQTHGTHHSNSRYKRIEVNSTKFLLY
jgi:hypothetical protein